MKMIFKIEDYFPDTKQVVIRYCRLNSPKPITNYPAKAMSIDNFDLSFDNQNLIQSIAQYGYNKVMKYETNEITLPENSPDEIPDSSDIADYVGKIISLDMKYAKEMLRSRKMRRIEIE